MTKYCRVCHRPFMIHPFFRHKRKHCSVECQRIARKGWRLSEALKKKISQARVKNWQDASYRHRMLPALLKRLKSQIGKDNPHWKGGYSHDGKYRTVYVPSHPRAKQNGYVREHRLIMEHHLGRILARSEIVHHINGNPKDNRIENLKLMEKRVHDRHHSLERRDPSTGRFF